MRYLHFPALMLMVLLTCGFTATQDMQEINHLWQQTLDALRAGDQPRARASFGEFNQKVRAYVTANGRSWQIEYLAGSLDCQFPESRASGAKVLQDILQNNRALNHAGEEEVRRQLTACTAAAAATATTTRAEFPLDIADNSAHFQAPGVHGDMKGGSPYTVTVEAGSAVSPIAESELLARRAELSQPQKALSGALGRLPAGASGGVVDEFAVVTTQPDRSEAIGIGNCLKGYLPPLKKEFGIEPSDYMVTVYTAGSSSGVYDYARRLHGLELPRGVIAYSVPEDMSLAAVATPTACGSMAHELVHLLIKRSFPVSPAWLEEGLASEVAIASPTPNGFRFSSSWRDETLRENMGLRPHVADLLEESWSNFSSTSYFTLHEVAATQAMAAVFIRYLDAKGKLAEIYFAVRDHHMGSDLVEYKSYREIVEEKLGMNVSEIDRDFARWFQQEMPARSAPDMNTAAPCEDVKPPAQARPCHPEVMNQANEPPVMNKKQ
jgi:hypothetical protein